MADIIAVLIVFGLLAALVGTLATGLIRIIGFGILVALALIIAGPMIRSEVASTGIRVESSSSTTPSSAQRPAGQTPYSSGPLPANSSAVGGPDGTYPATDGTSSRGVRAMW